MATRAAQTSSTAPSRSGRRRGGGPLTVVLALAATGLSFAVAVPSAGAAHRYTARIHTHATQTVRTTVTTTVSATASATVGTPPFTARVTVRVTGKGTGTATRTGWASARRSASTRARARSAARKAAHALAARRARSAARSVAHTRALSSARRVAQAQADAAAQAAATSRARALATVSSPTPASSSACTSLTKSGGGTWTCTFDEEFNGTALDSSKWVPVTTADNGYAAGPSCFVNSTDNIAVGDGVLNLTTRKTAAPFVCNSPKGAFTTSYTAAQVATWGRFSQTYGRFAVRAKFPATKIAGLQSSLWMWPQNSLMTGLSGEIDIAEEYSVYSDRVIPYLHYTYNPLTRNAATNTNLVTNNFCLMSNVNAFHEYAVEWTASTIKVIYDGKTCLIDNLLPLGASPFNQPFFLALSACLGIGTNAFDPAKTPLPATTQIDWVRAWK
jgi:beta-glucanase (GH16 family)